MKYVQEQIENAKGGSGTFDFGSDDDSSDSDDEASPITLRAVEEELMIGRILHRRTTGVTRCKEKDCEVFLIKVSHPSSSVESRIADRAEQSRG